MTTQSFFIPHRFPGLNDMIAADRNNRYTGGRLKKEWTGITHMYAKRLKPVTMPVTIEFVYYEPNNKRDPDNITAAKKYILDGLVSAGILPDDTQKWIMGFTDFWFPLPSPKSKVQILPKQRVGVSVTIKEVA